ncbi:MAG: hypothetical protein K8I03_06495 [Ignavibacteria bacterium]|nr:hypothetical protein [Ignavibacteria bacterium]
MNGILGWGNSKARIVLFSLLEEHGSWTIEEILKEDIKTNEDLKNLASEKNISFEKKIADINRKLKELMFDDIDTILDKQILGKINLLDNFGIEECLPVETPYSPTAGLQFELTSKVLSNRPDFCVSNNCSQKYFGTKLGNSISINFFPLGRNDTEKLVEEYHYFFGLKEGEKFLNIASSESRMVKIKTLLDVKIQKGSYIFIFGRKRVNYKNNYANRLYWKTYLEELGNEFVEYSYRKDSFFVNSSKTIFLLPTASPRNINRFPKQEDIPKFFEPENHFTPVKSNNQ